jgi:hypothetical protein
MAIHSVSFSTPTRELGKADVEFVVKKDGAKLGELHVSNGSVVWYPTGNSYGYKLGWQEIGGLIVEKGTRSERK